MDRLKELEELIMKHKALYYQGRPEITDIEYDKLEEELKELDSNNSVLTRVGSSVKSEKKIKHDSKMLSLGKTYNFDELVTWKKDEDVLSTFKIDGVSCSLIYEGASLTVGKTRGDGSFGENITEKVKWIKSIPKNISLDDNLEIRGELYCSEADFFHLSEEMVAIGLDRPTSLRNIVAGLVSRKENLELCRHISFQAFEYINDNQKLDLESDKFKMLKKIGFEVPDYEVHKSEESIKNKIDEASVFMAEGDYQIDGLVFAYNKLSLHDELGVTAHHPRYKMAFKFEGESKETIISEIIWNVSRNGILTPVANVEPVDLSGAMISRVTLHNYGMVKQHNLKAGDKIEIIRSGEVIPKFLSVVKPSANELSIPSHCPSCLEQVFIEDIRIVCRNENCPSQVRETILNFIQKIGIDDLSTKRLEEMLRIGLIKDISDLYKINKEDLFQLDKVKEKLADKLYNNIQESKTKDIVTFLSALGISGGAYNKCEKVVNAGFDTVEKLKDLSVDKIGEIESFAEKSATDFFKSLKEKFPVIDELITHGFNFEERKFDSQIVGKKICITGSLSEKRSVVEAKVRDAGGIISSSVSKNIDFLVLNDKNSTSSKFKKAEQFGVPIISEVELSKLL